MTYPERVSAGVDAGTKARIAKSVDGKSPGPFYVSQTEAKFVRLAIDDCLKKWEDIRKEDRK